MLVKKCTIEVTLSHPTVKRRIKEIEECMVKHAYNLRTLECASLNNNTVIFSR